MTTASAKLTTSVSNYLSKVEGKMKMGSTPIIYETAVVMLADSVKTYDVKTVFSKHSLYDLRSITVEVLVKDTDPNSPTNAAYVNSEAVVTHGVNDSGIVTICNNSNQTVDLCVKISSPTVLL